MNNGYQMSDYRSLELHSLVAEKLCKNKVLLDKALENIARWKIKNNSSQPYLDEWLVNNPDLKSLQIDFCL